MPQAKESALLLEFGSRREKENFSSINVHWRNIFLEKPQE